MKEGSSDRLDALPPGTKLQRYMIDSVLGHGGFGIVYQARHSELGALVAIKEYMPAELSVRLNYSVEPRGESCRKLYEAGLRRFLDEAHQLVKFRNHPGVVSCQDLFRENGTAYLVMEIVDGLPLSDLLRLREEAGQPFEERELLSIIVPLLEGLAAVHREGVLHRDIKPANILIRRSDEWPVLIDFGAAKQVIAEQSRSLAPYTEGYAAIEQVGAGELGPWTDLYGLGAVMWRVVAGGDPPWDAPEWKDRNWSPPNPIKVETRVQARAFHRPDPLPSAREVGAGRYSNHVLGAIDRCLRLAEEDRAKNCEELLRLLRGKRQETSVRGVEPSQPTDPRAGQPDVLAPSHGRGGLTKLLLAVVSLLLSIAVAALVFWGVAAVMDHRSAGETIPAPFTVGTSPSNAHVKILNDHRAYHAGMELPPGLYWVEVTAGGFQSKRVQVEHSGPVSLHRVVLERVLAGFRVETVPRGAEVRLVGTKDAYRPGMALRHGSYEIVVSATGYATKSERVEHDGRNVPRIELERTKASFRVETVPPGATVRILDGSGPYSAGMELPPGTYRVEISARGYETKVETVQHGPSPTSFRVELQETKIQPCDEIISPRVIRKVEPSYTDEAKEAKLQGTVMLSVEVTEDGILHNIRVLESLGMGLDERAIEAASQWRFAPATKCDKPVSVPAQIQVSFRLL